MRNCHIRKLINNAMSAAEILEATGVSVSVIRLGQIHPLPMEQLLDSLSCATHVVVLEEACSGSGISQDIAYKLEGKCKTSHIDLGNWYPTHGSVDELYRHYGLDAQAIATYIQEVRKVEN